MKQDGSLYAVGDTCYLKYYIIEGDGKRVHKTIQLCKRDDVHDWWKKKGRWGFSSAVRQLQRQTMDRIKAEAKAAEAAKAKEAEPDITVVDFWESRYLPHCEEIVKLTGQPRRKPETVRGFKQIWRQHLSGHFAGMTLKEYQPKDGNRFLRSLTGTQGKNTLKHIKALANSIFSYAVEEDFLTVNPWREVKIPKDAIESASTLHYTLLEAENIISALVDHVDAQLVLALACFLGLRPGEIAALRWEDFELWEGMDGVEGMVHIRRAVVRGVVGTPKTAESIASLPLPKQVIVPLELWRQASVKQGHINGWVFPSQKGTPIDLHNLTARVLRPHIEGPGYQLRGKAVKCVRCNSVPKASGVRWKTLYAGRRGAVTAVVEANNGNLAIGQALARHKNQMTTATFYKKAITPETLRAGVKMLEAAANGK